MKFFRLSNEPQVDARAREIMKEMRAVCDCGGDPRHPGWHADGCSLDAAWDRAWDSAKEDVGVFEEVDDGR